MNSTSDRGLIIYIQNSNKTSTNQITQLKMGYRGKQRFSTEESRLNDQEALKCSTLLDMRELKIIMSLRPINNHVAKSRIG